MTAGDMRYISYPDFAAWCKLRSYFWYADISTGVVYSTKTRKPLNNQEIDGYLYIDTRFMGLSLCVPVHRVIWIAAHGRPIIDHKLTIDHINGIRSDNRIENLRLLTAAENVMIGLRKCSPEVVEMIREEVSNGVSKTACAVKYQVSRDTVRKIVARVGCYAGA